MSAPVGAISAFNGLPGSPPRPGAPAIAWIPARVTVERKPADAGERDIFGRYVRPIHTCSECGPCTQIQDCTGSLSAGCGCVRASRGQASFCIFEWLGCLLRHLV